jgi:hypothetical protein
MENYIIRIYRRDENNPDRLTGLLESVEGETRHPFHSLNGLCALLSPLKDMEEMEQPAVKSVPETHS